MAVTGEQTDYRIRARIVAEDAVGSGADSAERRLGRVESRGLAVGASLTAMFAVIGGAYGVGQAVKGILGLQSSTEDARISLAGLFNATAGMEMAGALRLAQKELLTLQTLAAVGVGEFGEYASALRLMFSPLHQAGATLDQMNQLTKQVVAVGYLQGRGAEGAQYAAFDVQQALTAGVGIRTTPIVNQALRGIGVSAEAFNAMVMPAKLASLTKAFERYSLAADEMGKAWSARFATLMQNSKLLALRLTAPLFDRWKEQLVAVNMWMEKNQGHLGAIVEVWGVRLVKLWDHLIQQAGTYAAIVAGASVAGLAPTSGGSIGAAVREGMVARNTKWVIGSVGARAAVTAASAGGLSGGATAGLTALGQVLGKVAWPLAIATTAFLAIKGAIGDFPAVTGYALDAWRRLVESLGGLGIAFGSLTQHGSALNVIGAGLVATLGLLADTLGLLTRAVATLVLGLGWALRLIGSFIPLISALATGDYAKAAAMDKDFLANARESAKQLGAIWTFGEEGPYRSKYGTKRGRAPEDKLPKGKMGDVVTNIGTVHINVKAEVNTDPARLARTMEQVLDGLARNRRQPARNPVMAPG